MATRIEEIRSTILRALSVLEKSMVRAMRNHQDDGLTAMADLVKKEVEKIALAQAYVVDVIVDKVVEKK